MERYRNIETDSGITFFEEAGFLRIGQQDDPRVNDINDLANTLKNDGVDIKTVDDQYSKDKFPFLRLTYQLRTEIFRNNIFKCFQKYKGSI